MRIGAARGQVNQMLPPFAALGKDDGPEEKEREAFLIILRQKL
jgi:hypothetical protein